MDEVLGSRCTCKYVAVFVVLFCIFCVRFCVEYAVPIEKKGTLSIAYSILGLHFSPVYRVIILLKTGTAIAVITTPNTISTISSVDIAGIPAPNTITFRRADDA
jgi:hypothetical protein